MNSLFHALNIGTLANWLSMLAFGTVAVIVPEWKSAAPALSQEEEVRVITEDFTLGDVISSGPESSEESAAPSEIAEFSTEPVPEPPELPEIAEFTPLPEIPDLPAPAPAAKPAVRPAAKPVSSSPSAVKQTTAPRSGRVGGPAGGSSVGRPAAGASNAARLAQGRMPQPNYPQYSRRNNQTGTVVVEFTVDESGRVISAHAKSPSPWPLLNNEAVRTVRNWRFPPGGVMKLQRPIVFQLR